ncbi:DNA mismatch repair endonuclease MutL, partial [Myxococcota bacterium]|nr:DNA mismatch repair endonuclease MutL [Myxococcota bacterium]
MIRWLRVEDAAPWTGSEVRVAPAPVSSGVGEPPRAVPKDGEWPAPPGEDARLVDLKSDMARFPQLVAVPQKNYFDFARLSIVFAAFPAGGIDSSKPQIDGNSQHAVFSGEILTDRARDELQRDDELFPGSPVRLLPDGLIDQIAAGEVVERPASVVKELVENALDAGAGRIRIELREGGNDFIAVVDDGHGMSAENARLALRRHATSKITNQEDLERIGSFGFRGEALPAIASVSRLRLLTRTHAEEAGHEIRVEGGEIAQDREAGCPAGTRIEVANLFVQIPARRKFLKKPATEWGHAYDWLMRLALSLPGVHFEIIRDDREVGLWPATDNAGARIGAVLGHDVGSRLIPVTWEERGGRVEAWLSAPDHTRANTQGLYLFVNGRPVRDRLVRHAVLEAYRDWLPRGRYPVVVLDLTVNPTDV